MANDWKCSKCGGINSGKRDTCLGCNSPRQPQNNQLETPKDSKEYTCNVCNKKGKEGENRIIITAIKHDEIKNNKKYQIYDQFHRMRIFVCVDCRKEKGAIEKAIFNKAGELGRNGEFNYWDNSLFDYSLLTHGELSSLVIKDVMIDELYDNVENRTVQVILHIPGYGIAYKQGVRIVIDGLTVALFFVSNKPTQIKLNVPPGEHVLSIGKIYKIVTEANKTYDLDVKFDRLMGGWKITPQAI